MLSKANRSQNASQTYKSRLQVTLRNTSIDFLRRNAELHSPTGFRSLITILRVVKGTSRTSCTYLLYDSCDILADSEELLEVRYIGGLRLFLIIVFVLILLVGGAIFLVQFL